MPTDRAFADHPVLIKSIAYEAGFPRARSILHVGDLERIIASIRSHQIGDIKSIAVSLKYSVSEGFEFRAIHEIGCSLTAEFIAPFKAVRLAVQNRSAEPVRLLADRGIELGSPNVPPGNKQSGGSDRDQRRSPLPFGILFRNNPYPSPRPRNQERLISHKLTLHATFRILETIIVLYSVS